MELVSLPSCQIPPGGVIGAVQSSGGIRLRFARWRQTTRRNRGTVCLLQGRAEFIEKYFEVVTELRRRGFAVVAFDWRGQGGSDRCLLNSRKGHVDDFQDYSDDLAALCSQVMEPHCPKPHYALAHSMGGAVLLKAVRKSPDRFDRVVITAPMIAIAGLKHPVATRPLAATLDLVGLGGSFIPAGGETSVSTRPFAGNVLTSDPLRYGRNAELVASNPWLGLGDPTISWVHAAFRAMADFNDPNFPLGIETPVLIVAGSSDAVTLTSAAERVAARLKAGKMIVIPGAKHEIMMERDRFRDLFWSAFDAFVPGSTGPTAVADLDSSAA